MLGQSHLRGKPCFHVPRKPAFGGIPPTTLGMGAAEMQEIAATIANVSTRRLQRRPPQASPRSPTTRSTNPPAPRRKAARGTWWGATRCIRKSNS